MGDENNMCQECAKRTTHAQRKEFARITEDFAWSDGRGFKSDHLVRMFSDADSTSSNSRTLPIVALLNVFLMLTHICKSAKEYMRVSMNFLLAMVSVAESRVFLNHLRSESPRHHKMWHNFLMLAKYSPYLRQTIPESFGDVCCVNPAMNPQIAKVYLDGTIRFDTAVSAYYSKYRQATTIGICSCDHQTMCETEEECLCHDMPTDGNCNVVEIDATDRYYRNGYDWDLYERKQSDINEFAGDFFMQAEKAYQKKFLCELRYNIWLQSTLADDTELETEFSKPDTQRITRETARMRHEKTKQKNSRRSRQFKFAAEKGSNTGKNKSRRDVCVS